MSNSLMPSEKKDEVERNIEAPTKYNLALPMPVSKEFQRVVDQYGHGGKTLLNTLAVLLLLDLRDDARNKMVQAIAGAKATSDWEKLIALAKSGDFKRKVGQL